MTTLTASSSSYGSTGQYVARITGRDPKFTFAREFVGRKTGDRNDTTEADVDQTGLYEIRNIGRKGSKDDGYVLLVAMPNGELEKLDCEKEDAMKIARAMSDGRSFEQIVALHPKIELVARRHRLISKLGQSEGKDPEAMIPDVNEPTLGMVGTFRRADLVAARRGEVARIEAELATVAGWSADDYWKIRTATEAKKAAAAVTLDSAIESCWSVLQSLPEKEAKKVLSALKARVSPPKAAPSSIDQASEAPAIPQAEGGVA